MGKESVIFVLNDWIEQDTVLNQLFAPRSVLIYPGYADEPTDENRSYPYIRYQFMNITPRRNPHLKKVWGQYFIGDTDLSRVINAVERLTYLINTEQDGDFTKPHPSDPSGKYDIHDILVHTSTIPNSPSQDGGVWEQGLSFTMYYVLRNPGWAATKTKHYNFDALIQ